MDYLAYSYKENDIGLRFRKAYNKREVNGLVFQDYENYKSYYYKYKVVELDEHCENGELELLSKIELENIIVK